MLLLRACARFRRGALPEAEADIEAARGRLPVPLPVPLPGPDVVLAEIRLEQGRPAAAREFARRAMRAGGAPGGVDGGRPRWSRRWRWSPQERVELILADPLAALADLLECGRRLSKAEVRNPSVAPWHPLSVSRRCAWASESVRRRLVAEERDLAHAFGAPRALRASPWWRRRGRGRASIAAAPCAPRWPRSSARPPSWSAPTRSPSWARSCAAGGQRRASREALRSALDLAVRCGAETLSRRARQGAGGDRRAAAAAAHQRGRLADAARAPDRRAGSPRASPTARHRRPPDRQREDDRVAPGQRLPQARHPRSRRAGRRSPSARPPATTRARRSGPSIEAAVLG